MRRKDYRRIFLFMNFGFIFQQFNLLWAGKFFPKELLELLTLLHIKIGNKKTYLYNM